MQAFCNIYGGELILNYNFDISCENSWYDPKPFSDFVFKPYM